MAVPHVEKLADELLELHGDLVEGKTRAKAIDQAFDADLEQAKQSGAEPTSATTIESIGPADEHGLLGGRRQPRVLMGRKPQTRGSHRRQQTRR